MTKFWFFLMFCIMQLDFGNANVIVDTHHVSPHEHDDTNLFDAIPKCTHESLHESPYYHADFHKLIEFSFKTIGGALGFRKLVVTSHEVKSTFLNRYLYKCRFIAHRRHRHTTRHITRYEVERRQLPDHPQAYEEEDEQIQKNTGDEKKMPPEIPRTISPARKRATSSENDLNKGEHAVPEANKAARSLVLGPPCIHDTRGFISTSMSAKHHPLSCDHPPKFPPTTRTSTPLSTNSTTSENNINNNYFEVPEANKAARSLVLGPPSSQDMRGSTSTSMSSDHRPHSCDHPPKHVPATRATSPATSTQRPNVNNVIANHFAFVAASKAARSLVLGLQREQSTRGLAGSGMDENSDDIICDPFLKETNEVVTSQQNRSLFHSSCDKYYNQEKSDQAHGRQERHGKKRSLKHVDHHIIDESIRKTTASKITTKRRRMGKVAPTTSLATPGTSTMDNELNTNSHEVFTEQKTPGRSTTTRTPTNKSGKTLETKLSTGTRTARTKTADQHRLTASRTRRQKITWLLPQSAPRHHQGQLLQITSLPRTTLKV